MSYASIDDLRSQLGGETPAALSPEYLAKMMHKLPETHTVNREAFVLKHCAGKRVLEFGASGPLHEAIVKVAATVCGIDRPGSEVVTPLAGDEHKCVLGGAVYGFDLDDVAHVELPRTPASPDIIICGEVIEHLSNPGWFLTRLKRQFPGVPVIITVPNAFSHTGHGWLAKGIENVNIDHVAWYSPTTIATLLQRAGYAVGGLFYYNGTGPTSEGLVVVTE